MMAAAGAGKQGVGAITNLASYWIFGIPLAAFLAFKMHWGAHGLWWGLVTTNIMQVRALAALLFEGGSWWQLLSESWQGLHLSTVSTWLT